MLIFKLFGGQKVAHNKRHLGCYDVRAHTILTKVLSDLYQVSRKPS
jgi:hypothetical protein